jgi:hypothetical protein
MSSTEDADSRGSSATRSHPSAAPHRPSDQLAESFVEVGSPAGTSYPRSTTAPQQAIMSPLSAQSPTSFSHTHTPSSFSSTPSSGGNLLDDTSSNLSDISSLDPEELELEEYDFLQDANADHHRWSEGSEGDLLARPLSALSGRSGRSSSSGAPGRHRAAHGHSTATSFIVLPTLDLNRSAAGGHDASQISSTAGGLAPTDSQVSYRERDGHTHMLASASTTTPSMSHLLQSEQTHQPQQQTDMLGSTPSQSNASLGSTLLTASTRSDLTFPHHHAGSFDLHNGSEPVSLLGDYLMEHRENASSGAANNAPVTAISHSNSDENNTEKALRSPGTSSQSDFSLISQTLDSAYALREAAQSEVAAEEEHRQANQRGDAQYGLHVPWTPPRSEHDALPASNAAHSWAEAERKRLIQVAQSREALSFTASVSKQAAAEQEAKIRQIVQSLMAEMSPTVAATAKGEGHGSRRREGKDARSDLLREAGCGRFGPHRFRYSQVRQRGAAGRPGELW